MTKRNRTYAIVPIRDLTRKMFERSLADDWRTCRYTADGQGILLKFEQGEEALAGVVGQPLPEFRAANAGEEWITAAELSDAATRRLSNLDDISVAQARRAAKVERYAERKRVSAERLRRQRIISALRRQIEERREQIDAIRTEPL